MADGIITRDEEERLRASGTASPWRTAARTRARWPNWTGPDRVMLEARLAATSVHDGDGCLRDLTPFHQAGLGREEPVRLLAAQEGAVEGTLEDGLLSLDEENALAKHADYFYLTRQDLDGNGAQTNLVEAAVTRGIVPQRQPVSGTVPFNLMKSEQLVGDPGRRLPGDGGVPRAPRHVPRRQHPRGRGLYCRPSIFRSRPIEREGTVQADTGMLGLTTKHIHLAGSRKRFRLR